jgi:hypothetical protein
MTQLVKKSKTMFELVVAEKDREIFQQRALLMTKEQQLAEARLRFQPELDLSSDLSSMVTPARNSRASALVSSG